MKKVLNSNFQAGSRNSNEPRLVGEIFEEMLSSYSLFVKVFRQSAASYEDAAEGQAVDEDYAAVEREMDSFAASGWFRNTELCVDLKTFLRQDRNAKNSKVYWGLLRRDTDDHFSFLECRRSASANANIRNPHVFEGKYINVTQRMNDGHIRFNFKDVDFGGRFNPLSFAIGVMKEILMAFKCLGEEVIKTAKRVD